MGKVVRFKTETDQLALVMSDSVVGIVQLDTMFTSKTRLTGGIPRTKLLLKRNDDSTHELIIRGVAAEVEQMLFGPRVKLPRHVSCSLEHNPHVGSYETVEQWLRDGRPDWVSDAEREKAIATNELWMLQWYPHTPVGFRLVAASDLQVLLDYVNALEPGD